MIGLLGWALAIVVIAVRFRRRRQHVPRVLLLAERIETRRLDARCEIPAWGLRPIGGPTITPQEAAVMRVTGRCNKHAELGNPCTVTNCTTYAAVTEFDVYSRAGE